MEYQQGVDLDQDPTPTEDPNVKGPVEMTLTWSEHDRIVQRLRLDQTNRYNALDFALRQSAGFPTSPKNVVENAAHYLSFLSEEAAVVESDASKNNRAEVTSENTGVVANSDGSIINWKGENYVRQSKDQSSYNRGFEAGQRVTQMDQQADAVAQARSEANLKGYQTGAEDRQKLVLKRVHKLLLAEAQRYAPDERVTVKQAYDRVNEMLGFANWEF